MINCTFENGNKASKGLRHVTIGAIVVNQEKKVLLIKRAENMHNGGKYSIAGGFLDRGENTAEGTLRELKEETGYDGEIITLFRINDSPTRPKEDRQNVDFLYVVKVVSGIATDNAEVSKILWVSKEYLPKDEEFAFDHRDSILKYFKYLENAFPLPIIG
jgi:ADP-ribose pyrophosphatase YjhB (NUDIX family)